MFTTRPEIAGTFGVVATTHWIASAVGMGVLERGGNAFDAAVAAAFTLQLVEPHLCGPAGEVPILFHAAAGDETLLLCGQGVAPAAATIDRFRSLGLDIVPGSGLISAVVPGAFDAWLLLLRDHGTLPLEDVLAPALGYAERGYPLLPAATRALAEVATAFRSEWPTSAEVWLPGGDLPAPGGLFRYPALAATWRRLIAEAGTTGSREARIDRARRAWSQGFVADAIDRFVRAGPLMDASGRRNPGLLTADDMARWEASYEDPVSIDFAGWTICKTGPWGQGPVLLQALRLIEAQGLGARDLDGPDFIHAVLETIKLAFADREAFYGDPVFADVPLAHLLSRDYAAERAQLIGGEASRALRPGSIPGFEAQAARSLDRVRIGSGTGALGAGEPTMAHLQPTARPGDTVHLDVIDKAGNMVSATPSGGWPQSSPAIPGLGFALNTRAQMFWLEEGLPASLAPGKRPRTTLTPTLARRDGRPALVCGTPGGDQQDQWQLVFLLRRILGGMKLQQAIDLPLFHSVHFPSSFFPREALPGVAVVEESFGAGTIAALERRGHEVRVAPAWSVGRLTAAERQIDGLLNAAATPRLMQAYAIGR